MRKYKFRGKRHNNGEWIYGDLIENQGRYFIYHATSETTIEDYDDCKITIIVVEVESATVGQSTGFLDHNGQEIYEGDILIEPSVATIPLEVKYNERQCAFCLIEHTHTEGPLMGTCPLGDMLRHYPSMKVVGNIHYTPEILTKWQTK